MSERLYPSTLTYQHTVFSYTPKVGLEIFWLFSN